MKETYFGFASSETSSSSSIKIWAACQVHNCSALGIVENETLKQVLGLEIAFFAPDA